MNEELQRLNQWVECLLDSRRSSEHRLAAEAWFDRWLEIIGWSGIQVTERCTEVASDLALGCGKAISPLGAARCLTDHPRTACFLQGLDSALQAALARFPGETIHVLEAGCGPFSPLALAMAARYSHERVQFTLLDANRLSLDSARKLVHQLGLSRSVSEYLHGDATNPSFAPANRPHVVVCELAQRALAGEPQVAATLHLATLLRIDGFFLPAEIVVHAALFDAAAHYARAGNTGNTETPHDQIGLHELGLVFRLAADALPMVETARAAAMGERILTVPAHDRHRSPLHLLTRIRVFGEHRLGDFACAITVPERVPTPPGLGEMSAQVVFDYGLGPTPGVRLRLLSQS